MTKKQPRALRLRGGASARTRRSVSAQELLLFNQEFIALVRAGLPIPAVLELIEQRPEQPMLRRIIITCGRLKSSPNHRMPMAAMRAVPTAAHTA